VVTHQEPDTPVVVDPSATYFGTHVEQDSLVTGSGATLAPTHFADWLASR